MEPISEKPKSQKKPCRFCGAEKGPGKCQKCGKDARSSNKSEPLNIMRKRGRSIRRRGENQLQKGTEVAEQSAAVPMAKRRAARTTNIVGGTVRVKRSYIRLTTSSSDTSIEILEKLRVTYADEVVDAEQTVVLLKAKLQVCEDILGHIRAEG